MQNIINLATMRNPNHPDTLIRIFWTRDDIDVFVFNYHLARDGRCWSRYDINIVIKDDIAYVMAGPHADQTLLKCIYSVDCINKLLEKSIEGVMLIRYRPGRLEFKRTTRAKVLSDYMTHPVQVSQLV